MSNLRNLVRINQERFNTYTKDDNDLYFIKDKGYIVNGDAIYGNGINGVSYDNINKEIIFTTASGDTITVDATSFVDAGIVHDAYVTVIETYTTGQSWYVGEFVNYSHQVYRCKQNCVAGTPFSTDNFERVADQDITGTYLAIEFVLTSSAIKYVFLDLNTLFAPDDYVKGPTHVTNDKLVKFSGTSGKVVAEAGLEYAGQTSSEFHFTNTDARPNNFTCSTASDTSVKIVTNINLGLYSGLKIYVKFTYSNTASQVSLNVGSTTYPVYYNGNIVSGNIIKADTVYSFMFDDNKWYLVSGAEDLGVFDISVNNLDNGSISKYASLEDALGLDGANVPLLYRRGGLNVRYIDSTTNKYVNYMLLTSSWSVSVDNWQRIPNLIHISEDDYEALPTATKMNGDWYFIEE